MHSAHGLARSQRPREWCRLSQLESTLAYLVHNPLLLQRRKLQCRGKSLTQGHLAGLEQNQDSSLVSWLQVSFSNLLQLNRLPENGVALHSICLFCGSGIQAGLGWAVLLLRVMLTGSLVWFHLAVAGLGWKVLEGISHMTFKRECSRQRRQNLEGLASKVNTGSFLYSVGQIRP